MTTISWTDETWNPWQGCTRVSPGCANCYMFAEREGRFGIPSGVVTRSSPTTFRKPLSKTWKDPRKIFTCSWSDFFHEGADSWRNEAWDIIRQTPQHTYQILTKRPLRILACLPRDWGDGWDNVWLGVSIESQQAAWRASVLASQIPARIRFISAEPLLGPVDFDREVLERIQWVIGGGESGLNARAADLDWFRSLRDQCTSMGISYWHKQNGGRSRDKGGILLDGQVCQQFPGLK